MVYYSLLISVQSVQSLRVFYEKHEKHLDQIIVNQMVKRITLVGPLHLSKTIQNISVMEVFYLSVLFSIVRALMSDI